MRAEYIIKLKLHDSNKNFGETLETIEKFIKERDGVLEVNLFKELQSAGVGK